MVWSLKREHPDVLRMIRKCDCSDIYGDFALQFQHQHFLLLHFLSGFVWPTLLHMYFLNGTFFDALLCYAIRYILVTQYVAVVNSVGHLFGDRPYNSRIKPTNNFWVILITWGEGECTFWA